MMKKFVVASALVASLTSFVTPAFAVHEGEMRNVMGMADISLDGGVDIRSRNFSTLSTNEKVKIPADVVDTQSRMRLGVNVKSGEDYTGRIQIENDYDSWGRFESPQGNAATPTGTTGRLDVREAWLNFRLPYLPAGLKGGHQLLQLGNGWFFRSMKYGSDAWVLYNVMGGNQLAFVNVKISEGVGNTNDDVDAYVLLDVFKLNENHAVGADFTMVNDRRGFLSIINLGTSGEQTQLNNLGLNYNGKLGPLALKAEFDLQMGTAKNANLTGSSGDATFKGMQGVVQANVMIDPVTINATAAYGTGQKANSADYDLFIPFLDSDTHYTLLYEYKIAGPCGATNQGFCGTTALSAGVSAALGSFTVGADAWFLMASEDVTEGILQATALPTTTAKTNELGTEIDAKLNWKMYDNLSWNWTLGYFMPGKAFAGEDAAMGAQGVLSYQF